MKLSPRDAEGYFKKPDPDKTGLLIYGADAMRVALKRQQILAASRRVHFPGAFAVRGRGISY